MHVFIDTNIFLNFYHYSNDELDGLSNVFSSHEHGSATVYVTEQVRDEFFRNRDGKIKDAIKKFSELRFNPQFPSFMKGYEEFEHIRKLAKKANELSKSILKKVNENIDSETLPADNLIRSIFDEADIAKVTQGKLRAARSRIARGNPPGKNSSLGDAINWEILLEKVPQDNDLHIISADGDFFSTLNENNINSFLSKEWSDKKESRVFVYRNLSEFMKEHFDGVAFSYDKKKEKLIDLLSRSGSFARTHELIESLDSYEYFSLKEAQKILDAAVENNQFGCIVTDHDVSDFINKHAVPRFSDINDEEHREILQKVIQDQRERAEDS